MKRREVAPTAGVVAVACVLLFEGFFGAPQFGHRAFSFGIFAKQVPKPGPDFVKAEILFAGKIKCFPQVLKL